MTGERLKIAVDFDEPLKPFKPGFFDLYNKHNGTDLRHEDAPAFNMSSFMGFSSLESYMDFVDVHHEHEMQNSHVLSLREDAVHAIRVLSSRFEFAVVTARKCRFKPYTIAQMSLVLPNEPVEAYHLEDFQEYGITKGYFAKSIGAVALIDDRIDNVESALEAGIHGLLFDDQFNLNYDGLAVRVSDWLEIEEELDRLYKNLVVKST